MNRECVRKLLRNTFICLIFFGIVNYLHYVKPHIYVYLIAEDWWGEYASFCCFLFASLILSFLILIDERKRTWGHAFIALICVVIAMEEISWGQRILGFSTPSVVERFNAQAEFNIHNILLLYLPLSKIFCFFVLLWIFGVPFLASKSENFRAWLEKWGIPQVPLLLAPFFILGASFLYLKNLVRNFEMAEFFIGLAFLIWATGMLSGTLKYSPTLQKARMLIVTGIFVSFAFVLYFLTTVNPNISALQWQFKNTASVKFPELGCHRQALEIFEYLRSRPGLWAEGVMLQYGLLLMKTNDVKAEEVLQAALDDEYSHIRQESDRPVHVRNIAVIFDALGRRQEAESHFQKALDLDRSRFEQAEHDWEKVTALKSMGETYFSMKDYNAALRSLAEAQSYAAGYRELREKIDEIIRYVRLEQNQ